MFTETSTARLLRFSSIGVALAVAACNPPITPPGTDAPIADVPVVRPDAGPVLCTTDDECDDTMFCNGIERCRPGAAETDARGCLSSRAGGCLAGQTCYEVGDRCVTECEVSEDADGDGVNAAECGGTDCDDADADRFPGHTEVCDELHHDEDCDPSTFAELDMDRDGAFDARCCNVEGDTMACGTDCVDYLASVHPGAPEDCDGRDQNCNGEIDEGVTIAGFVDADRDQHGDPDQPIVACQALAGFALLGDDCDDTRIDAHGARVEICDGRDNDCDALVDEAAQPVTWYRDADGDGYGSALSGTTVSCVPVAGYALLGTDCDDTRRSRSPLARESCNGIDDDCDGVASFPLSGGDTEDDDGDGVPDIACPRTGADCDDRDPHTRPGAPELCDHRDNDCDGNVEATLVPVDWYLDRDGDGWGDGTAAVIVTCEPIEGRVTRPGDCGDRDPLVAPGRLDACGGGVDGSDDDCDSRVDEGGGLLASYADGDDDGFGAGLAALACTVPAERSVEGGDCDDEDPVRLPGGVEDCDALDGRDDDCDGLTDCEDADCRGAASCGGVVSIALVSGGGQSVRALELAPSPIVVRVTDELGAPAPGLRLSLRLAPGLAAEGGELRTDAGGRASVFLRAGLALGAQTVTVVAPGASSIDTTLVVTAPAVGLAATLMNPLAIAPSGAAVTAAASSTVPGTISGLASGTAGELYVADGERHCIYRIDVAGALEVFAGRCGAAGNDGDEGAASEALLEAPGALVVTAGRLVVADTGNHRLRAIDLASRTIVALAGGGLVGGDGVDVSLARIWPAGLAVDEDGDVWALDVRNPARLVEIDETNGVIRERWRSVLSGLVIDDLFGNGRPLVVAHDDAAPAATRLHTLLPHEGRVIPVDAGIALARGSSVDPQGNLLAWVTIHPERLPSPMRLDRRAAYFRSAETLVGGGTGSRDHVLGSELELTSGIAAPFGDAVVVAQGNRLRIVFSAPRVAPALSITAEGIPATDRLVASTEAVAVRVAAPTGTSRAVTLEHDTTDPGAVLAALSGRSDATGLERTELVHGPVPGTHRFSIRLRDFAGRDAVGSPVTYTLRTRPPPAGALSMLVGPRRYESSPLGVSITGSALLLEAVHGSGTFPEVDLTVDGEGAIYFGRQEEGDVVRIAPDATARTAYVPPIYAITAVAASRTEPRLYVSTLLRIEDVDLTTGRSAVARTLGARRLGVRPDGTLLLIPFTPFTDIVLITPGTFAARTVHLETRTSCDTPLEVDSIHDIALDPRNGDAYLAVNACGTSRPGGTLILRLDADDDSISIVAGNGLGSATSLDPDDILLPNPDLVTLAVANDGTLAVAVTGDELPFRSRILTLAPGASTFTHVAGGGSALALNGTDALEATFGVSELAYMPDGRLLIALHEIGPERPLPDGGYERGGVVVLW